MSRPEGAAGRCQAAGTAEDTQRTDSLAEPAEAGKQAALTRLGEMIDAAKKSGVVRTGPDKKISSQAEPIRQQLADLGIDKKVRL